MPGKIQSTTVNSLPEGHTETGLMTFIAFKQKSRNQYFPMMYACTLDKLCFISVVPVPLDYIFCC